MAALPRGRFHRLPFLLNGEDLVVLYSSGDEIAPDDVRADIEAIQQAARDKARVTLSAGVSDLCTEPGMLPQAYPAGMPYFDTEQVEKALLAQDYDALRAEIDRVLLPLAQQLPEYRAVDQLCLSLLFHVSLWGLRYGIQMEEVLRSLGAHYTDIYALRQAGLCAGLPVRVPAGAGGPPPQPQPHRQERGRLCAQDAGVHLPGVQK